MNIVFQIHKRRKCCGRFTDIVALRINDPCCYFLSWGRGQRAGGEAPGKVFESRLVYLREMPFLT